MNEPDWIDEVPEHLQGLLRELLRVRHRGVWGLREVWQPIPRLLEIAALLFPRVNRQSQRELVKRLLEQVSPLLPPHYRDAIPLYFWFDGNSEWKSPETRRKKVGMMVFHQGWWTFRRWDGGSEPVLLIDIAETIKKLAEEALRKKDNLKRKADPNVYVRREELHQEMASLIDEGDTKIIVLEGAVGTGKSRLAWEFSLERADASQVESFTVPNTAHFPASTPAGTANWITALERTAAGDDAPAFLIVEAVDKWHGGVDMLPKHLSSTVIITSRRSLKDAAGITVRVGPLTPAEAMAMARPRLEASVDLRELERLVSRLGYNALAIEQVCGLLAENSDLTVRELCRSLDAYAAQAFTAIGNEEMVALPFVYRELYRHLSTMKPIAAELLKGTAFVFAGDGHVPLDLLEIFLAQALPFATDHPAMAKIAFRNASRELVEWHLLEPFPDCLHVNLLTQDLLRDLLRESGEDVCNRLLASLDVWETRMRSDTAELFEAPILQEMVSVNIARKVYEQEIWIKMQRASLSPSPEYQRQLEEAEDRRDQVLGAQVDVHLRLVPWLLENASIYSI